MLTGRVDDLRNAKIYGWAFNSEQPDEHLIIRVMQGPQVIASSVANIMRPDLPESGVGKGDHAFEILMPPNITSFHGLMLIAQSVKSGEIALPIATNDERKLDDLFSVFSQQYEDALIALKEELDAVQARCEALESGPVHEDVRGVDLPEDLHQRLVKLEQRIDSAEVFFIRIDESVRQLVEQAKKGRRKRFLGIF
jgi:hypothetical protein